MRHAAASLLLADGMPITAVSAMLGHALTSTTLNTYAHVLPGSDRLTAEARCITVVSGADIVLDEEETVEELAAELGEEARMLREEPDEWYAGFVAEVTEVDRRVLERSEVRAITIEMFQEAVRQGAVGWADDVVRLGRPWPFLLDEVVAEVRFHHGEDDTNVPPQHAKELAERIPGSRLLMYPGEGHISVFDNPVKGIVETLLAA